MLKKSLFLILLNLINHTTYNATAAAASSEETSSSFRIESREEFKDFLKDFFRTKNGFIQSGDLPEYKFIHICMDDFKGRKINFVVPAHKPLFTNIFCNSEISKTVYTICCKDFLVPTIDKFLKILYCLQPGRIKFCDSGLFIKYDIEPDRPLSQEEFNMQQMVLQKEILIQQITLQKLLEQKYSKAKVSQGMQTEQNALENSTEGFFEAIK